MRSAPIALVAVLQQVLGHFGDDRGLAQLKGTTHHANQMIRNTRGIVTGALSVAGTLRFLS
jgi:hypothetical protein